MPLLTASCARPRTTGYAYHVSQFGKFTTARVKKVTITCAEMVPTDNLKKWLVDSRGLFTNATGAAGILTAVTAVTLPPGVTLTSMTALLQRRGATSTAKCTLFRMTTGTHVSIAAVAATTGGVGFRPFGTTVTEVVASNYSYLISVRLQSTNTNQNLTTQSAGFLHATFTYTVPHLGAAY